MFTIDPFLFLFQEKVELDIAGTLLKKDSFSMSKMIENIFRKAEC